MKRTYFSVRKYVYLRNMEFIDPEITWGYVVSLDELRSVLELEIPKLEQAFLFCEFHDTSEPALFQRDSHTTVFISGAEIFQQIPPERSHDFHPHQR